MRRFICDGLFKTVREKNDPLEFDSDTKEWIQVILGFLEEEFELDVRLHVTFDLDHYNKYSLNKNKVKSKSFASVYTETGLIWINPKKHNTDPKVQLMNSLVHEAMHCREPSWSESEINEETNRLVKVQTI